MYNSFGELPGFTAVKLNGLHVGVEDSYFIVVGIRRRSADCVEHSERTSGFLNSF
jgi:hypothetical protein